jgi:hypothetical protein
MQMEISYRCAHLDVELADRVPVVHGIERGHLVDTHRRHLKQPRHLVHDADAREAVLSLAKVEQRHYGGLLVLRGVSGQHLLDELLILWCKLERDGRVVDGRIAVDVEGVAARGRCDAEGAPLGPLELAESARGAPVEEGREFRGHCVREGRWRWRGRCRRRQLQAALGSSATRPIRDGVLSSTSH